MPYTITFDEKFDLEEGELKFVSLSVYQDEYNWSADIWDSIEITSDVSDYGTIDNTGNITVIENFEPEETDYVYVQFGYFVDNELVKSTKLISLDEVSTTPTNISDIEYLYAIVEPNATPTDFNGEGEIEGTVRILTILPEYDSDADYNYSGIQIKARAGWGQTAPIEPEYFSGEVIVNCNTNGTYSGNYTVSDSVAEMIENEEWWGSDSFTAEILNPNIIPKRFSTINYS